MDNYPKVYLHKEPNNQMSFINSDFQRKHIGHYPFFKNLFVVVHDRYSTKIIFSFLVEKTTDFKLVHLLEK